jgi:hypothetical protein
MWEPSLREVVSQGDIFRTITLARIETVTTPPEVIHGSGILLSHDCGYDKPRVQWVLVTWDRSLTDVAPGSQGNVRAGRVRNCFYLSPLEPHLPESLVDFEHIVPVSKPEIARLSRDGHRIASLTDAARLALQQRLHVFFSRAPDPAPPGSAAPTA